MKRQFLKVLLTIGLVLPLSGCPGTVSIAYGVWIFTITYYGNPNPTYVDLAMLQHGLSVQPPSSYPGNYGVFGGPMTWQQDGSNISLFQDGASNDYSYTGSIQSSTSLNGTWVEVGNPSIGGTWSAEWDPDS